MRDGRQQEPSRVTSTEELRKENGCNERSTYAMSVQPVLEGFWMSRRLL